MPSPEVGDNRLILDGEVSGLEDLPAGSRIDLELTISGDGRIGLQVLVPGRRGSGVELEAFVDGVADSATTRALATATSALTIRE